MVVYVVTSGSYSDYGINAMFTTKEKAEEYALTRYDVNEIEEYALDEPYDPPEYIVVRIADNGLINFAGAWGPWCEEKLLGTSLAMATVKVKYNANPDVMKKAAYDRLAELKAEEAGIV